MHDFFCKMAGDMLNGKLSAKVGYMKDEGGVSKMCELMQKLADKEAEERVHSDRKQNAERMLRAGATVDFVVLGTQLSKEEVEELAKRIA